jgi:hypothetical protein
MAAAQDGAKSSGHYYSGGLVDSASSLSNLDAESLEIDMPIVWRGFGRALVHMGPLRRDTMNQFVVAAVGRSFSRPGIARADTYLLSPRISDTRYGRDCSEFGKRLPNYYL